MMKPTMRMRRMRQSESMRALYRETDVLPHNLVQPYFVVPGKGIRHEVRKGLGLWHFSPDMLVEELRPQVKAGLGAVMLFGVSEAKTEDGSGLEQLMEPLRVAISEVKSAMPEAVIMSDVCLCTYTKSGHCGLIKHNRIDNDSSLPVLANMAVKLAQWGSDFVCPSDMMDGRVRVMRDALDEAGLIDTSIMSYAVKMASAMYGPFRLAADSSPTFGDRRGYQMPAHNRREALREFALDEAEGADVLLVKPALTNLDLIRDARETSNLPLAAYHVSGEYAMLRAAADAGLMDFERGVNEVLASIRRAGADLLITYAAKDLCLK